MTFDGRHLSSRRHESPVVSTLCESRAGSDAVSPFRGIRFNARRRSAHSTGRNIPNLPLKRIRQLHEELPVGLLEALVPGQLAVVARDLKTAQLAGAIAPTLQAALDDWANISPQLEAIYAQLNAGQAPQDVKAIGQLLKLD